MRPLVTAGCGRAARCVVCAALLGAIANGLAEQWPMRLEARPRAQAGSLLVGKVLDASTGRPIAGAHVQLATDAGGAELRTRATDSEGRFVFLDLNPGRYSGVSAEAAGYVSDERSRVTPVGVGDPRRASEHVLLLRRAASLSGRVSDELGTPQASVAVRAFKRTNVGGRDRFVFTAVGHTDDRGAFRLWGLSPGSYVLGVLPSQVSTPAELNDSTRVQRGQSPTGSSVHRLVELSSGMPSVPKGGLSVGDITVATQAIGVWDIIPPRVTPGSGRGDVYVVERTYFPGVPALSGANVLELAVGADLSGLDMVLRRIRGFNVSGVVELSGSGAGEVALRIVPERDSDVVLTGPGVVHSGNDVAACRSTTLAEFECVGVPSGHYRILAYRGSAGDLRPDTSLERLTNPPLAGWRSSGCGDADRVLFGEATLDVPERDVHNLRVEVQTGVCVSGRISYAPNGTEVLARVLDRVRLMVERTDEGQLGTGLEVGGAIGPNGQFRTRSLPRGKYVLGLEGLPEDVSVAAVTVDGQDALRRAVRLDRDVSDATIRLVRSGSVSGVVARSVAPGPYRERAVALFVFPADDTQWYEFGRTPPHIRRAVLREGETYRVSGLPPGEYLVAAIAVHSELPEQSAATFKLLRRQATAVNVEEGANAVSNLQVIETTETGRQPSRLGRLGLLLAVPKKSRGGLQGFVGGGGLVSDSSGQGELTAAGALSGSVFEGVRPAADAQVTLVGGRSAGPRTMTTDVAGRFEFRGLEAGHYSVSVAKPGWLPAEGGSLRGYGLGVVNATETAVVSLGLDPGAVLEGAVVDSRGKPIQNVVVEAEYADGRTVLLNARVPRDTTDDRGTFRVFGLWPGTVRLLVRGPSTSVTVPTTTREDLARADRLRAGLELGPRQPVELPQPPGSPSTAQPTLDGTLVASPWRRVSAGQEVTNLLITASEETASVLHGRVVDASGRGIVGALLELGVTGSADVPSQQTRTHRTETGPDGVFSFGRLTPGTYFVRAHTRRRGRAPSADDLSALAVVDLTQNQRDAQALLALQPSAIIAGIVRFGDDLPAGTDLSHYRVRLLRVDGGAVVEQAGSARVDERGAFVFVGVFPGKYVFTVLGPDTSPWYVASSVVGGREINDTPLVVAAGETIDDVRIEMTLNAARVTGRVPLARGQMVSDLMVWIVPAERQNGVRGGWRYRGPIDPAPDGGFSVRGLPPGDYRVLAAPRGADSDAVDLAIAAGRWPAYAVDVTVALGITATVSFRR